MTVMTYPKDGGERYPVATGQTWVVAGRAVLTCGNLYDLPPLPIAELACTDLPWGNGPRNTYHSKAGLAHAEDPFSVFIVKALSCIRDACHWAIEIGNRDADTVAALCAGAGRSMTRHAVTYYKTKPCTLLTSDPFGVTYRGLDEAEFTAAIIAQLATGCLVTDPCTGRGLTAVTALEHGHAFHGYELSPWRCSVTLSKLAHLTGQTPERIA